MIDAEFQTSFLVLLERCAVALERQASAVEKSVARRAGGAGSEASPEMSDAELDADPKGDHPVQKDPKKWTDGGHPSYQGKPLSRCPPEFLEMFANGKEFQSQREFEEAATITDPEAKKKKLWFSTLSRADARRARGWARRIRAGWTPPPAPEPGKEAWRRRSGNGAAPPAAAPAASPAPEDRGYPKSFDDFDAEPAAQTPAPAQTPETEPIDLEKWDE